MYIHFCPKCKATYSSALKEGKICSDCGIEVVFSGYTEEQWTALPREERAQVKTAGSAKALERMIKEQQVAEQVARQKEERKRSFANSFQEFYEYDVVTIINENHGQVDRINMMRILQEHAQEGWKLHSIYSNELGKNALRVLGFGINATACEDVLIFERRIEKLEG